MTVLDFAQLAGAMGLGAILTKLLDVCWLQKVMATAERRRWLREQRLRVYSSVAEELMALGRARGTRSDAFQGYALMAQASLLVEDDRLVHDLEVFFTQLGNLYAKGCMTTPDVPEAELNEAYALLYRNSRELVKRLRRSLQQQ